MTLQIQNKTRQGIVGSAAAIVCFPDKPDEPYLLSASHVLAATHSASVGDAIIAVTATASVSAGGVIATLSNWTGLIDGVGFPNLADAAIARLSANLDPATTFPDLTNLAFARTRPSAGAVLTSLSPSGAHGPVRSPSEEAVIAWKDPGGTGIWDYGMADHILAAFGISEGDAGAPVLNSAGELVGIISGMITPSTNASDTNTVISAIENITQHAQWKSRTLVPYPDRKASINDRARGISDDSRFRAKVPMYMAKLKAEFQLDDIQAAGIMGNIGYECGGFHLLQELNQPPGKGGYGWAQWTGPRRASFVKWCADQNPALDPES